MSHERVRFGLLLTVTLAALGLAGCASDGEASPRSPSAAATPPPAATAPPPRPSPQPSAAPSQPSPTPSAAGGVKEFDVELRESGFNGQKGLTLRVNQGDTVRIVFTHAEPYGDDHPIYFTCTGRAATVTATSGPVAMEFLAEKAGTCSFFCTNGDCGPHESFQGGKIVVEA